MSDLFADMDMEWKILAVTVLFTVVQAGVGFVVMRFVGAVDRLAKAVDKLVVADARSAAILEEHGRRLDGLSAELKRMEERCFNHLRRGS
jgi:hypothetical protein